MKILSKKKYNKILDDCKELQKKVEELKKANESIKEKLETEKTSFKVNSGKDFCFSCEHSYMYETYFMGRECNECGCLLNVPCESFKRRKDS
jgi:ABC-type Fe3+-citrate transport system substrate-binding protein